MENLILLATATEGTPSPPPVISGMAALLKTLGEVFAAVIGHVGTVATTIVDQPLLLLTVGFLFIGGIIGIFGRLLSRG